MLEGEVPGKAGLGHRIRACKAHGSLFCKPRRVGKDPCAFCLVQAYTSCKAREGQGEWLPNMSGLLQSWPMFRQEGSAVSALWNSECSILEAKQPLHRLQPLG